MVLSVLTARGAAVVAERKLEMEARWTDALHEFSDADLAAATKVLNRVADLFESLSHEAPAP